MSTAFILVPGALLPVEPYANLDPSSVEALNRLAGDADKAVAQRMPFETFARLPHYAWLWRVLSRETTPPGVAPWLWTGAGARPIAPELWRLVPASVGADGRIKELLAFDEEDVPLVISPVEKALGTAGMRLQLWDNVFYGSRADAWGAATVPGRSLLGEVPGKTVVVGDEAAHRALDEALTRAVTESGVNEARAARGLPAIDVLLAVDGGAYRRFAHPTLMRSVVSEDPVIRGWAESAGIPPAYITAGTDKGAWPAEAPDGDVIAVIDDLIEPKLASDWGLWAERLPGAVAKVEAFRASAAAREAEATLVICFGDAQAVTLAREKKGLLKKLFRSGDKLTPDIWCPERGPDMS